MKWCKWCQKDTHNSEECWSTHAVPPLEILPAALSNMNPPFQKKYPVEKTEEDGCGVHQS